MPFQALAAPQLLADPQFVDALERRAADAADEGVAIPADQRIGHRPGAGGTVKLGGWRFLGH